MKTVMRHGITPRERELLSMLEGMRREGKRITIVGFAKAAGYSNKSALRHFPILKKELSDYVEQFASHAGTRGRTSSVRSLEVQVERLERELGRREEELKKIPVLKERLAALEKEKILFQTERSVLRGMLSTLLAFIAGNNIETAMLIEARLMESAMALINNETLSPDQLISTPDSVERTKPHLVSS